MSAQVEIGTDTVTVPELNGIKALEALRLAQVLIKLAPGVMRRRAEFVKEYGQANYREIDRANVRLEYPPRVLIGDDNQPILDEHGELRTVPSPFDRMTETDWETVGHKITLRDEPNDIELGLELLPLLLDTASEPTIRLIALTVASNDDVLTHKRAGDLDAFLLVEGEELLHRGTLEQVIELAVIAIETANGQVRRKIEELGERWGNALSAFGKKTPDAPTGDPSTPSTASSSSSSTPSPDGTAGTSGRSSEPAGVSS